jgi:hypothetical protein
VQAVATAFIYHYGAVLGYGQKGAFMDTVESLLVAGAEDHPLTVHHIDIVVDDIHGAIHYLLRGRGVEKIHASL